MLWCHWLRLACAQTFLPEGLSPRFTTICLSVLAFRQRLQQAHACPQVHHVFFVFMKSGWLSNVHLKSHWHCWRLMAGIFPHHTSCWVRVPQEKPYKGICQPAWRLVVKIAFTKIIQPKTSERKLQVFKFQFQSNKWKTLFDKNNTWSKEYIMWIGTLSSDGRPVHNLCHFQVMLS